MIDEEYAEEPPVQWMRCILCGEEMPAEGIDWHECDIIPFEEV